MVGALAPTEWPPEAVAVPKVGDSAAIDLERIVALRPDLVVAWPYVAPTQVGRLRELGIEIAIDDFGTGYSNLAYLTSLPLDTLKIDRGLIAAVVGGGRDRIVGKAVLGMARGLGVNVGVRGSETSAAPALGAHWARAL